MVSDWCQCIMKKNFIGCQWILKSLFVGIGVFCTANGFYITFHWHSSVYFHDVESQEHGLRGADGATWGLADLALGPGAADLRLDADNIDPPRNRIVRTSLRYRAILCKGDALPVLNAVMEVAKFSGAGTPTTHVVVPMPTVSRPIRQRNPNHSNIIDPSLPSHVTKRKHQQKKKLASDKGRMSAKKQKCTNSRWVQIGWPACKNCL